MSLIYSGKEILFCLFISTYQVKILSLPARNYMFMFWFALRYIHVLRSFDHSGVQSPVCQSYAACINKWHKWSDPLTIDALILSFLESSFCFGDCDQSSWLCFFCLFLKLESPCLASIFFTHLTVYHNLKPSF